jgi:prepilin signal peptidase PulO-like enzyme (type II secretory pathway)
MILVFLFLFGLAIGSFLNVLILRINTGETLGGRSRCFSCLAKLAWYDLVPLASYFAIRGKCRYCRSKVSWQYPIVELMAGVIFVVTGWIMFGAVNQVFTDGKIFQYILNVSFFSTLLAASVYDIRHKIIPDQFSLFLFVVAVISEVFMIKAGVSGASLGADVLAASGAFIFFGGLWLISRGAWMGFGDAKLAISLGLFLGYPGILFGIVFAFWSGALFGIAMMVAGRYGRKTEVPFAPFLALGTLLAFIFMASGAVMSYYNYISVI